MSQLIIIGNSTPEIGKEFHYNIAFSGFGSIPNSIFNPYLVIAHWEIYVLERGQWRKTSGNAKEGDAVSYTFKQSSLTRKGIKLKVTKGDDMGELIIKPKRAGQPKINKITLLDVNGHKVTQPLSYRDTLTARAECTDMEGEILQFTLWEDDAKGEGHNTINAVNKINTFPVPATVKKGIAEVKFNMAMYWNASMIANMQVAKGDKNEGKTHEYYVTAEYFGKLEASNNVNLKNPAYHPNSTTATNSGNKGTHTSTQPKQPATPATNKPKTPNKRPEQPKPAPKKETYKVPVTPKAKTKAPDPKGKIISVSFVDFAGRPVSNLKTSQGVTAKILANNMKGKTVRLTVWDEDPVRNDRVWSKDIILAGDESYMKIPVTEEMWEKGDDGGDSENQDYFLEVEYAGDDLKSSVIKVNNDTPPTKQKIEGKSTSGVGKTSAKKQEKGKCPRCDNPVTTDDLKQIFKNADNATLTKVAATYSKYMKELGMNTCWNKAHLFAQARVETGSKLHLKDGENFNWYWESLISTFKAFQTTEGKKNAKNWGRAVLKPPQPGVSVENQKKIANWAYSPPAAKAKELGNTEANDGWNFRGKGLIQLTGRNAYTYANTYTKQEGADIISNPDLVLTNIAISVISSMAFFKWKKINIKANGNKKVKQDICPLVGKNVAVKDDNGNSSTNYDEKQKAFNDITSKIFKVDECQWGKIADEPVTQSSSDSVLEEMKKLVDQHIPYSQSGTRNKLDADGLKNLDCSETVGIYLHKLGVMPNYKAIDTSTMTTEANFRNTIGTKNIDLVSGSDKKDFKPQRGDVFVWRKGAAGPGHTGIVYKYDETTDIVTILEAIGSCGAVSESDQVKNGGYSKAGCSRTAKYSRLKGALYGHKGWAGYFRPKNYTRKL